MIPAGHVMQLAQPNNPGKTGPGNWRAECSCGLLDGPERGRRKQAVDDHDRHLVVAAAQQMCGGGDFPWTAYHDRAIVALLLAVTQP